MFDIAALLSALGPEAAAAGGSAAGMPIPLTGTPGNPAAAPGGGGGGLMGNDNGPLAKFLTGGLKKATAAATALGKPKTVIGQTGGGMGQGGGGSPMPGNPVLGGMPAPSGGDMGGGSVNIEALLKQIFGNGPGAQAFQPSQQPAGFGMGQLY